MVNKVYCGNNLDVLKEFQDNFFDSIVTDPPYELNFMGKKWDNSGIAHNIEIWQECLRVLKPGGYLLAFGGTRTYHRMVCAIEDAGFVPKDTIVWMYGSGFPKSLNIGKAVDKLQGNERKDLGEVEPFGREGRSCNGKAKFGVKGWETKTKIRLTKGTSEWEGWGTALKPACELITVSQKPLSEKTYAENVLKWGVGGINIDGCRIEIRDKEDYDFNNNGLSRMKRPEGDKLGQFDGGWKIDKTHRDTPLGRFPANVILDEEAGRLLDEQTGTLKSGYSEGFKGEFSANIYGKYKNNTIDPDTIYADSGGASRFFYCAKASKSERNKGLEGFDKKENLQGLDNRGRTLVRPDGTKTLVERFSKSPSQNNHPTVKPIALMQYLTKLVTPKNGIVLDPFAGSGTTGIACKLEGFNYVLIEQEKEYCDIVEARIKAYKEIIKQEELF